MIQTYVRLNDKNKIPQFGLGVNMIAGDENTRNACLEALEMGCRYKKVYKTGFDRLL